MSEQQQRTLPVPRPKVFDENHLLFLPAALPTLPTQGSARNIAVFYDPVINVPPSRAADKLAQKQGIKNQDANPSASDGNSQLLPIVPLSRSSSLRSPTETAEDMVSAEVYQEDDIMTLNIPALQVPRELNNLRIIQFPGCKEVNSYLRKLDPESELQLLESGNLRKEPTDGFITGLSLRAVSGSSNSCTIFIAIPYLSSGVSSDVNGESLSLSTFVTRSVYDKSRDRNNSRSMRLGRIRSTTSEGIEEKELHSPATVSQVYFVISSESIENDTGPSTFLRTIGVFRSAEDAVNANKPLLFPGQPRVGPLDTLVGMLAMTVQGWEKRELANIRTKLLEQENEFQDVVVKDIQYRKPTEAGERGVKRISLMLLFLKCYSCRAESIRYLIETQLEILRQLHQIFENSYPDELLPTIPETGSRDYWEVPCLSKHQEELLIGISKLDRIIKAREALCDSFKVLIADIKDTQKFLFRSFSSLFAEDRDYIDSWPPINSAKKEEPDPNSRVLFPEAATRIAKRREEEQRNPVQATLKEIKATGEMISMFTVFTNVFLPLGFFTAYYSMDIVKDQTSSVSQFWKVAGPCTAIFTLFSLAVALHKKDLAGELGVTCDEIQTFFQRMIDPPLRTKAGECLNV